MQEMINAVSELYKNWAGKDPVEVDVLPQSGSDRRYFRLHTGAGSTVIATCGINVAENDTFMYFAHHFKSRGLHVPEVYAASEDRTIYLQEDLGDVSLLYLLE